MWVGNNQQKKTILVQAEVGDCLAVEINEIDCRSFIQKENQSYDIQK